MSISYRFYTYSPKKEPLSEDVYESMLTLSASEAASMKQGLKDAFWDKFKEENDGLIKWIWAGAISLLLTPVIPFLAFVAVAGFIAGFKLLMAWSSMSKVIEAHGKYFINCYKMCHASKDYSDYKLRHLDYYLT